MVNQQLSKILNKTEISLIKKLNSPIKIQDYLDALSFNFESDGETYMSPIKVLEHKTAHCFEGALFAALCFKYHGVHHYLLDLKVKKSAKNDSDHIVCIFNSGNFWGAVSKTNHSVLRYRDPIFVNFKELAKSYFHEYFLDSGEKTLESFSKPYDVWKMHGTDWVVSEEDLDDIALGLDRSVHLPFVSRQNRRLVRKAGKTEVEGAAVEEWKRSPKMLK